MGTIQRALAALGRFLRTVFRSCYDMELYRDIRVRPWPPAFRYFVAFNLLVVVLTLFDLTPTTFMALGRVKKYVADKVPDGASLSIKAGVLETDLPTPYNFGDDRTPLIIDTSLSGMEARPPISGEQGVVFGRDTVYIKRSENDRQAMALKELPDIVLSKASVLAWIERNGGWLAAGVVVTFAVVYFLVSLASGAIFVLLASLLASFFGALWKVRLDFNQWLAVGFHAVTLPTLINALFDEFGMTVPLVFTFLFFMVIVAVIADERAAPTKPLPALAAIPESPAPAAPSEPPLPEQPPTRPKRPRAARKPARTGTRKQKTPPPGQGTPSSPPEEEPPPPPHP